MSERLLIPVVSSSLLLLAALPGIAAGQARIAALDDDATEALAAPPRYEVIPLDFLSDQHVVATVFDLRSGFVPGDPLEVTVAVGGSFAPSGLSAFNHAVTYGGDGIIADISAGRMSEAHGMNALETVVGFTSGASGYRAFRYDHGVWTTLPRGTNRANSNAMAVNDNGLVVGYDSNGWGASRAVYWTPDNQPHLAAPGATTSELYAVNKHDVAVGYAAFGASGGHRAFAQTLDGSMEMTLLPAPFAVNEGCYALAINDGGRIVGIAARGGAYQPVLWKNGRALRLPVLPGEGSGGGRANDINRRGEIVGNSNWGRAVLWSGRKIYDLNELASATPFFLTNAVAINDQGVIACHASNGATTVVLLVPQH